MAEPTQKPEAMKVSEETRLKLLERQVETLQGLVGREKPAPALLPGDISCVERAATESPTTSKVLGAFVKAQAMMALAKKGSNNPFLNAKYSDLGDVITAIREPLAAHELGYMQFLTTTTAPDGTRGTVSCRTKLLHSSGEWVASDYELPVFPKPSKKGEPPVEKLVAPADFGAAGTLARRFALTALLGVASGDEDAEGARAQSPAVRQALASVGQQPVTTRRASSPPSAEQLRQMSAEDLEAAMAKGREVIEATAPEDPKRAGLLERMALYEGERARRFSQLTEAPAA